MSIRVVVAKVQARTARVAASLVPVARLSPGVRAFVLQGAVAVFLLAAGALIGETVAWVLIAAAVAVIAVLALAGLVARSHPQWEVIAAALAIRSEIFHARTYVIRSLDDGVWWWDPLFHPMPRVEWERDGGRLRTNGFVEAWKAADRAYRTVQFCEDRAEEASRSKDPGGVRLVRPPIGPFEYETRLAVEATGAAIRSLDEAVRRAQERGR